MKHPPISRLARGLRLFHATASTRNFDVPCGPAWFSWDKKGAKYYLDVGYVKGPRPRILEYVVVRAVDLPDTAKLSDWILLAMDLTGEDDPLIQEMVKAVCKDGLNGWAGRTEVMLCKPELWIRGIVEKVIP